MGITYKPIKEIIIYPIEKHDKPDFLRGIINPHLEKIGWANGVMFMMTFINPTDADITKDFVEKQVLHVGAIDFCECKFEEIATEKNTNHRIMVIDQSKNPIVQQIIEFVKNEENWANA